jgi:hypothetical protein
MDRKILVLGTNHGFQREDSKFSIALHLEFADFLLRTIQDGSVVAIAEENNLEALAEHSRDMSVPERIAAELGIPHRHCDPNHQTRAELGIRQENSIRVQYFPKKVSETEVLNELNTSDRKREEYWLQQLLALNSWPVLFICGANHVDPFLKLIENNGIQTSLIASDWGA